MAGKQQNNNVCDKNPCQNKGRCERDRHGGFTCICPYGKGGKFCEKGTHSICSIFLYFVVSCTVNIMYNRSKPVQTNVLSSIFNNISIL